MHLPDGFLDAKTALASAALAATGISVAVRHVRNSIQPRQMPLLGLAGAFVFAAQMINFPVLGGTSGHLIGGVLTAILLGPGAAVLVITCVLITQCLMFADGGLLALGANIFNMAIVSVCGGYFAYRTLLRFVPMDKPRGTVFAAAFAGWAGTVLPAVSCAGELALSKTVPWSVAFPAMTNLHMLIGIGEGLATGLVVLAILRSRPALLDISDSNTFLPRRYTAGYALLVALGLAIFVAPFACPWPDGLETVARQLGLKPEAAPLISSPLASYQFPLIHSAPLATAVTGAVGTIIAFIAAYALARLVAPLLSKGSKHAPRQT